MSATCPITLNTALTPAEQARWQDAATIRRLVREARAIAIVGLSADSQKASHFVASYLLYEGFRVIPVNPRGGVILGQTVHPDLASIPEPVDIVEVFRPAHECLDVARQATAIGAKALWLQLKVINFEAAELAAQAGLAVVMDKCFKMEHGRYGGSLHWAGMNTEILTAKKARR